MKRYWLANSSDTPPTAPTSTEDGYPQDGNIALNHKPTKVGAWWYHMITEEFMAVIEQAGLEPSYENLHQLADVFADFKERASGAETYKDAAEAAADRAEKAATQVVTDVDSAIAKVQAATDSEISRLNTRAEEVESSTSSGLTNLQNKLTELIANLEHVGGEQAAYVKQTAQEILDSIIPVQTGNAGKFLTTDGTNTSWETVDALPSQSGNSGKYLKTDGTEASWEYASGLPVGTEVNFYGATAPDGYLICNGAAVSRTAYPELFSAIGTSHGAGDGSTTFNLPDRINYPYAKGVASASVGTKYEAGLPNIKGNANGAVQNASTPSGAFSFSATDNYGAGAKGAAEGYLVLDASTYNDIYSDDIDTVQPPSVGVLPCIKAFDSAVNQGTVDVTALANQVNTVDAKYENIPHIINSYHDDDGNWYRIYSDGWVEQGGLISQSIGTSNTVNLMIEMANTKYIVNKTDEVASTPTWATQVAPSVWNKTTTSFYSSTNHSGYCNYIVMGYKA